MRLVVVDGLGLLVDYLLLVLNSLVACCYCVDWFLAGGCCFIAVACVAVKLCLCVVL